MDCAVGVQALDALSQLPLSDCPRKLDQLGMHAGLGRGQALVPHINARRRIVSCKHDGEPRLHSALHKRGHPLFERRADRRGQRFSVEDLGCHGGAQSSIGAEFSVKLAAPPAAQRMPRSCQPFRSFPQQTIRTR